MHNRIKTISPKIYNQINNKLYDSDEDLWWEANTMLHLIKVLLNPVRISYIQKKLNEKFPLGFKDKPALEIGCGGGILCEEIAGLGIEITGIDPSQKSVNCAIKHSKENHLLINYRVASGENLPFEDQYFDIVFCCDVLEHVQNLAGVISEISRVLKPDGIFIYDTINRTIISNLVVIKILQKWKHWAIFPENFHLWKMFIKPVELKTLLMQNNLEMVENKGIVPDIPALKIIHFLHQRVSGKLSYEEFGSKFCLKEGKSLGVSYLGYAIKKSFLDQNKN